MSLYAHDECNGISRRSKWEDVCKLTERLDCVNYRNLLASLENGFYIDCRKSDNGTVTEMTVFSLFDNAEQFARALAKQKK